MTNSERRVGLVRRLLDPPGEARADWEIYAGLACALGHGEAFAWASPAEVYDEWAALTAGRPCDVSGVSHERLRREGSVQWPAPARPAHDGTARLYADGHRPPTADGRARFAATPHAGPADACDEDFPLVLTTGRLADQWHTMSRTGKSAALRASAGGPSIELHPGDAPGIADGDRVRVRSRRGEVLLAARLDPSLPRGVAFAPFHFGALHAPAGAGALNAVSHASVDPVSKQPELKAIAVAVEGSDPLRRTAGSDPVPARRLVVVGTGMAGLAVVEEVLRRDPSWRVTMLGEEHGPVYNRILLSRLLAGECGPGELALKPLGWYAERGVDLRGGCAAAEVDAGAGIVRDVAGGAHPYDALVLATGSRPFLPPVPGMQLPHVSAFRTRGDVDAIAGTPVAGRRAVVLGGGLLGLEAAAGLRARGARVTVVEPAPRLMGRQLDGAGAAMLEAAVRGRGIDVRTGVLPVEVRPGALALADGAELEADLVVVAAGVRAETTLAEAAGLPIGRGIVVDDALRAGAERVWAVGECAEHRGTVYGLWAPLAEQARVAGAAIAGDPAAFHPQATATVLKVAGLDVYAGGRAEAGEDEDEVVLRDTRRGVYRKLVLDGERLVGAVLLGDVADARRCTAALRSGDPVDEALLSPGAPAPPQELGPDALVCSCNAVTADAIDTAITAGGLTTVAQVAHATRASTGCGGCATDVRALLGRHRSSSRNTSDHPRQSPPSTMAP
jgi:ferredoxin-nitrate reductase